MDERVREQARPAPTTPMASALAAHLNFDVPLHQVGPVHDVPERNVRTTMRAKDAGSHP